MLLKAISYGFLYISYEISQPRTILSGFLFWTGIKYCIFCPPPFRNFPPYAAEWSGVVLSDKRKEQRKYGKIGENFRKMSFFCIGKVTLAVIFA
jgi:hypothetical protein